MFAVCRIAPPLSPDLRQLDVQRLCSPLYLDPHFQDPPGWYSCFLFVISTLKRWTHLDHLQPGLPKQLGSPDPGDALLRLTDAAALQPWQIEYSLSLSLSFSLSIYIYIHSLQ